MSLNNRMRLTSSLYHDKLIGYATGPISGVQTMTAFGLAYDFYDTIGVNTKFAAEVYGGTAEGSNNPLAIARLQEMNLRHIREGFYGTTSNGDINGSKTWDSRYQTLQIAMNDLHTANLNKLDGVQNILVLAGAPDGQTAEQPYSGGDGQSNGSRQMINAYTLTNAITSTQTSLTINPPSTFTLPSSPTGGNVNAQTRAVIFNSSNPGRGEQVLIVGGQNTTTWTIQRGWSVGGSYYQAAQAWPAGSTIYPIGFAYFPYEWFYILDSGQVPWGVVGGIQGPNEPDNWRRMESFQQGLVQALSSRGSRQVAENTLLAGSLPVVIPTVQDGAVYAEIGDWTDGTRGNVADWHDYSGGHEPDWNDMISNYNSETSFVNGANGSLPFFMTEMGQVSAYSDQSLSATDEAISGGSGYWPVPLDVQAEYTIRQLVQAYMYGYRQQHIYNFVNFRDDPTSAESNFGLLYYNNLVRKPVFYALRNLLALIGYNYMKTSTNPGISVSGFVSNDSLSDAVSGMSNFSHTTTNNTPGGPMATTGSTYGNGADHATHDYLQTLLLQQSEHVWIMIVTRQVTLWDREPQIRVAANSSTNYGPTTQNLTLNLPSAVNEVASVVPTNMGDITPMGSVTDPMAGQAWTNETISNNKVSFVFTGYTTLFRIATDSSLAPTAKYDPTPTVTFSPADNATVTAGSQNCTVTFSSPVEPSSSYVQMILDYTSSFGGAPTWSDNNTIATFNVTLASGHSYSLMVPAGTCGTTGTTFTADTTANFTVN